jgi:hypothetical protein
MDQPVKNLFIIPVLLFLLSCRDCENNLLQYHDNSFLSDKNGKPGSDSTFIFPFSATDKAGHRYKTVLHFDSVALGNITHMIALANEPLLYNYYSGNNIFRFILTEGQRRDTCLFIFHMEKKGNGTIIREKRVYSRGLKVTQDKRGRFIFRYSSSRIHEFSKELPRGMWDTLETILKKHEFLCIPSNLPEKILPGEVPQNTIVDGWNCFMELHSEEGYYCINRYIGCRYEDDENFMKIYSYILTLTTLNNKN